MISNYDSSRLQRETKTKGVSKSILVADIPNCLSFFKDPPPSTGKLPQYSEVYSSSRLTLYRSVALLAGMYREHLPGLRIGILSVHRGTRRSPDQKLRTLL